MMLVRSISQAFLRSRTSPAVRLVPARLNHVGPIAHNLREHDRRECEAFGRSPKQALRISLATSFYALTAITDRPVAMFGVTPVDMMLGKGSPWFLGTDDVFNYARELMTQGPRLLAWFGETFPLMENFVSSENAKAIRLLRAWGAEIGEGQAIGGLDFVKFSFSAIQGNSDPE